MPFRDKPPEWAAQLRIAQALVPLDGATPAILLERLEAVLAAAPRDSRKAVFSLND